MTQITVKRAVEALNWVHNNAHFEVGTEYHATKRDEEGRPLRTHAFFRNHFDRLRVPDALCGEVFAHLKPNTRKFDTRMYALKPSGKRLIGVA